MKRSFVITFVFSLSIFILKLIVAYIFSDEIRTWEDHDIAVNLAKTGSFWIDFDGTISHTYQFPVYPFLVSKLYQVFNYSPYSALVLNLTFNFFTSLLLILLFNRITELFFNKFSAQQQLLITYLPVFLFVFHPGITYYAMFNVHPFSCNQFFLLLLLYVSFPLQPYPLKLSFLISIGLVAGIAILDRATSFLGLLPLFINLLMQKKVAFAFKYGLIITAIAFLTVLPWLIRNYQTDGIFGFETSAGKNLWKGSIPDSEGSSYLTDGNYFFSKVTKQEFDSMHHMSPKQQYDYFTSKWKANIQENPAVFVKLYFKKLRNFWWFRPNFANEHTGNYISGLSIAYKIIWGIALPGIVFLFFMNKKAGLILLSTPIALSLLQAVFYTETRHRMVIEPLLIFVSLVGFYSVYNYFYPKKNLC